MLIVEAWESWQYWIFDDGKYVCIHILTPSLNQKTENSTELNNLKPPNVGIYFIYLKARL